jgi:hypothetical protein
MRGVCLEGQVTRPHWTCFPVFEAAVTQQYSDLSGSRSGSVSTHLPITGLYQVRDLARQWRTLVKLEEFAPAPGHFCLLGDTV